MLGVRRTLISGLLLVSLACVAACGSSSSTTTNCTATATTTCPTITFDTLTLAPAMVNGGQNVKATVTLTSAAQTGGVQFTVSSPSNSVIFNNQIVYTFKDGQTSFTFQFQTLPVGSNQTVLISAVSGTAGTISASLIIVAAHPLTLTGFTLESIGSGSSTSCQAATSMVVSGGTVCGTVTLNAPAYSPGQSVGVVSSDPAVLPVNPVTVPTGATTITFGIYTQPINAQRTATITATLNTTTINVQLTLMPTGTALTSLSFNPSSLATGQTTVGTITITPPAPAGGETVSLTVTFANSATPQGTTIPLTFPATVSVPAGATQAQFTASATKVTTTTDLTVTATLGATGASFNIEIVPSINLTAIGCLPSTLTGGLNGGMGNSATCTISLSLPAPDQGQAVQLTSSSSATLPVPASVTVPQGSATFGFSVTAGSPTTITTVTLTAMLAGSKTGSVTTNVLVVPAALITVIGLQVNPSSVLGGAGGTSTGTLTISGPAPPGGLTIALTSSDPSTIVPATATVPQGATTTTFNITTMAVAAQVNAVITATVNTSTQTITLIVVPPPVLQGISLSSTTVSGGSTVTATLILANAAPAIPGCPITNGQGGTTTGACVSLSASLPVAQLVSNITVVPGSNTANVLITTLPVTVQTDVVITATLGTGMIQVTLTVIPAPPDIKDFYFNPPTVFLGQSSTGTVVIAGPAPPGGTVVTLASVSTVVTVPAQVTVPAGQTAATFTATTATSGSGSTGVVLTAMVTSTIQTTLSLLASPTGTATEQLVAVGETNSTDFPAKACPTPSGGATEFCGPLPSGDDTGFVTSIGQSTPAGGATTSTLTFSDFVGLSTFGQTRDVFVDSSGNVFACGVTSDQHLPTTSNAVQPTYGGGNTDAFIVEFNSSGALQYLSYFGGSGDETCYSITVVANGNIFISGKSDSTDLSPPSGVTVFQATNAGGYDFFVASINYVTTNAAAHLAWLTFVGGISDDFADGRILINPGGNVFVSGTSSTTACNPPVSTGFPVTVCPNLAGVGLFGVVVQLSSDGSTLISTTILAGGVNGPSPGTPTTTTASGGIALDVLGNLYVCGQTNASNLPNALGISSGIFQQTLLGQQDAYVARITSATGAPTAVTYVGGTGTIQSCRGIAVDSERNPVIVLPTDAPDFASTFSAPTPVVRATPSGAASGPVQLSGPSDFAVVKLTSDLSTAIFATLVGGSGSETGTVWAPGAPGDTTRVSEDAAENWYFSLPTTSTDFPITTNALFNTAPAGGNQKVAVVKLSSDGSTIVYATYLGGSSNNSSGALYYHLN